MQSVAIIGAGASGLAACMYLSKYPERFYIQLFEKNNRIARKIAATGNGRCNLSNAKITKDRYHGDVDALFPIIESFDIHEFCTELGFLTRQVNDLYYPYSEQAKTVVSSFEEVLASGGVTTFLETNIVEIKPSSHRFILKDNQNRQFKADIVIVAVGGKAGKVYGTDGSSFKMLEKMGIEVTDLYPSLVQLKTANVDKELKGSRVHGTFTLQLNSQVIHSYKGEILFTDDGVSGIAAMQMSRFLNLAKGNHYTLHCNFIDELSKESVMQYYQNNSFDNPYLGIVNAKLAQHLNRKETDSFETFYNRLTNYTLKITGTRGFESAQVTKGGVKVDQLDENLMVKAYPNLYIAGETLNIDGDCGGFNLHACFAMGKHIANSLISA